jgi:hypothetical protein
MAVFVLPSHREGMPRSTTFVTAAAAPTMRAPWLLREVTGLGFDGGGGGRRKRRDGLASTSWISSSCGRISLAAAGREAGSELSSRLTIAQMSAGRSARYCWSGIGGSFTRTVASFTTSEICSLNGMRPQSI